VTIFGCFAFPSLMRYSKACALQWDPRLRPASPVGRCRGAAPAGATGLGLGFAPVVSAGAEGDPRAGTQIWQSDTERTCLRVWGRWGEGSWACKRLNLPCFPLLGPTLRHPGALGICWVQPTCCWQRADLSSSAGVREGRSQRTGKAGVGSGWALA